MSAEASNLRVQWESDLTLSSRRREEGRERETEREVSLVYPSRGSDILSLCHILFVRSISLSPYSGIVNYTGVQTPGG